MNVCTLDTKTADINIDEFIKHTGSIKTPVTDIPSIQEYIHKVCEALLSGSTEGNLCIYSVGQNPATGKDIESKFKFFKPSQEKEIISFIESVCEDKHRNISVPLVLYREGIQTGRGKKEDIISVFGLVADFDDENAEKYLERLPLKPSIVTETSKGRYQAQYRFCQPVSPSEASAIAEALTAHTGCDSGTSDINHTWRIPGTLNWPNKKKCQQEGRSPEPQLSKVIQAFSDFTDPQELKESLRSTITRLSQEKDKKALSVNENTNNTDNLLIWDGQDIETLPIARETKDLILNGVPEGQRSEAMMTVINGLVYANCTDEQILQIFEQYSIGEKYREKGSDAKWLVSQINKARAFMKDRSRAEKHQKSKSEDVVYPLFGETCKNSIPFPVEHLPEIISDAAHCIHESMKAPMPLICHCMLASISSVIQPHINVEIDGRIISVNNFYAAIAESGERKSAIDKIVQKPISDKQKRDYDEYIEKKHIDFALHNAWRKKIEAAENEGDPDSITKAVIAAGKEPKFIQPLYIMDDPTYQAVLKRFSEGRFSLTLNTTEGGQFIGGYSMSKENKAATISGLSKLWDGEGVSKNLSESIQQIYGRKFGLSLMFQPVFISAFYSDPVNSNQGFLSRVLSCYPESAIGDRPYSEKDVMQDERTRRYYSSMNEILELDLPLNEKETGLEPRCIKLSPEAKKRWIDFYNEVETAQKKKGELYDIRGFASKTPEHVLREAAKISFFCDHKTEIISLESIEAGVQIMRFYLNEALRLFDSASVHPDLKTANKVYEWGLKHERGVVTLTNLYQKGPSAVRTKKKAEEIMYILSTHNMATEIKDSKPKRWMLKAL